ncbi:F-box/WD-40 repeat-containing protein At3g52030 [Andrographis paniculata]|uniref:F-box/WD-40 repeat-containing protein At3g52030 n=1 Tax=Andrographis paniculata TaxID=175694 RepID=UPI0021E91D1A|nr:F-box/WD-40 repeat-containing protein At3g52030 [Andrographis paniculata]
MEPTASAALYPPPSQKRRSASTTKADALGNDVLCMIFAFLDFVQLIRCSAVCKSWCAAINKLKLLQIQYQKQRQLESAGLHDGATCSERSINLQMEQLAMERQRLSLQQGPVDVFKWKGHSVGFNKCRMKMGLVLTGVGDKVMRLWSAESCKGLDEYCLPDKAPLIDFDFDEGKVVGLLGTRMCIWRRIGTRDLFSSRDGLFTSGLCMRYVDPLAAVGCEDGKVRIYDMYSRKISQIIKMHPGSVSCLSYTDEQLIISGSSHGGISMSDLSSDQRVATLRTSSYADGIKCLCFNPASYLLFAGSTAGHASCWDLRTSRRLWDTRVSPNVIYSMHHLQNDKSTLVIGGIDGVLRVIDQDSGEIISRYIVDENRNPSHRSTSKNQNPSIEHKQAIRLSEDDQDRLYLTPSSRPPITCLCVGMQKVVTAHGNKHIRVWKFRGK